MKNTMNETEQLSVISEILSWKWHDDDVKYYFIKQFLLGWTNADYIHRMTERDNRNR